MDWEPLAGEPQPGPTNADPLPTAAANLFIINAADHADLTAKQVTRQFVTQSEVIAVIRLIPKGQLAMPRYMPTKINCNCHLQSIEVITLQVSQLGSTDADLAQALKMGLEPFLLTAEKLNNPVVP